MPLMVVVGQDGEDAVKIGIGVKMDGDGTLATSRAFDFNFGLERRFKIETAVEMRLRERFGLRGMSERFRSRASILDELFGLMDRQLTADNSVKESEVPVDILDIDKSASVSHTDLVGT